MSGEEKNIAAHIIASGRMENLQSYIQRGRHFAS